MKGLVKFFLVAVILFLFSSCNKATLSMGKSLPETPSHSNRTYSYLMGYYEFGETNQALCEQGSISRIEIKRGVLDSVIHIIAGGIVSSRTQLIYCE
jgi:hypothetical protein